MANGKASTSVPKKKSKSTTRPSGLLTAHEVLVAKVRDDLNVLVAAGYFVSKLNATIDDSKMIAIYISPPYGVDLSIIDHQFAISGKVLE